MKKFIETLEIPTLERKKQTTRNILPTSHFNQNPQISNQAQPIAKWKESVIHRAKLDARLSIHLIKGIPPNMITDSEALKEAAIEMFGQYTSAV